MTTINLTALKDDGSHVHELTIRNVKFYQYNGLWRSELMIDGAMRVLTDGHATKASCFSRTKDVIYGLNKKPYYQYEWLRKQNAKKKKRQQERGRKSA